ncbi:MAG: hypothetical protein EXR92_05125 [Gemmatimonadetes bacterium]|nr:hypothetical protein [Gemmatimonadota bacterium]
MVGAGLLVLSVAGVMVAAVATPAPHTGGDNAGYLSLAHSLISGDGYVEAWDPAVPPHTKYPPVFPVLLAGLMLAGASTWTAFKTLSAIGISLAALLAFAWASRRSGPISGVAVALLAVLSFGWLDASRWILSEPTFLTFTFLALWAADRAIPPARPSPERLSPERLSLAWLGLATLATALACLTRAAGAPLGIALIATLLLARRVSSAAAVAGALAVPGIWWVVRSWQAGGAGAYQSEFWMVNPYDPGLGVLGWLDLPIRAWANLRRYVGAVLPREWWPGLGDGWTLVFGVVMGIAVLVGWWLRVREREAGTADLFAPLYFGMVLVWPEVWSGERFLLPLYPLLLLYAGEALRFAGRRLGHLSELGLPAVGFLILALPALPAGIAMAEDARMCRSVVDGSGDVFQCHSEAFQEFREAAVWSGANLPSGAVVLNRKPRIFYLLGGIQGRVFPFSEDSVALLDEADRAGARYLLLDHVDALALHYLPPAIQAHPLAFCYLGGWGGAEGQPRTDLIGILRPGDRLEGGGVEDIGSCPATYRAGPPRSPRPEGLRIPLLVRP